MKFSSRLQVQLVRLQHLQKQSNKDLIKLENISSLNLLNLHSNIRLFVCQKSQLPKSGYFLQVGRRVISRKIHLPSLAKYTLHVIFRPIQGTFHTTYLGKSLAVGIIHRAPTGHVIFRTCSIFNVELVFKDTLSIRIR